MQRVNKDVIEVQNLSFAYGKQSVLKDVNFTIKEKSFLAIIGPNGGGKSTLFKLLLGINPLQKGEIKILGKEYLDQIHNIGYVPQNTNININFPISVLEVVMMGQNNLKTRLFGYKKEEKTQALEALKKVNMDEFFNKPISALSGGQRQRVFIARALFSNPKILLLDEPTSSIDTEGSRQIYETLVELNKEITVVVVSHDISVILQYATEAFYINQTLFKHDLGDMKREFKNEGSHICEVELLKMLGSCKC